MIDDNLLWLVNWFKRQCDGDWEHHNGIKIGTIDNPGWYLKVSLEGTELEEKKFERIRHDKTEEDWLNCFLEEGIFNGFGGTGNLSEILSIFREWAEQID